MREGLIFLRRLKSIDQYFVQHLLHTSQFEFDCLSRGKGNIKPVDDLVIHAITSSF